MSIKVSDEKLVKIKELRLKGYSLAFISEATVTSFFVVQQACKGLKIDLRFAKPKLNHGKDLYPCNTYKFTDLSEKLQQYYLSLAPPVKNVDNETIITASKGDYGKAAIFEDYRAAHGM